MRSLREAYDVWQTTHATLDEEGPVTETSELADGLLVMTEAGEAAGATWASTALVGVEGALLATAVMGSW